MNIKLHRVWELCACANLVTCGGVGFGSSSRNDEDFGSNQGAFRDMRIGAELELELCPHLKLVPSVDLIDYFTDDQRRTYGKHNGFVCTAGCRLVAEF